MLHSLEGTFLATSTRQMVAILSQMSERMSSSTRVQLLANLQPVIAELKKIGILMPQYFYTVREIS